MACSYMNISSILWWWRSTLIVSVVTPTLNIIKLGHTTSMIESYGYRKKHYVAYKCLCIHIVWRRVGQTPTLNVAVDSNTTCSFASNRNTFKQPLGRAICASPTFYLIIWIYSTGSICSCVNIWKSPRWRLELSMGVFTKTFNCASCFYATSVVRANC